MPTVSNVVLTLTTVSSGRRRSGQDQGGVRRRAQHVRAPARRPRTRAYDTHVTIHDFDGGDTPGDQILDF